MRCSAAKQSMAFAKARVIGSTTTVDGILWPRCRRIKPRHLPQFYGRGTYKVQVQAVDALDFQQHVFVENFRRTAHASTLHRLLLRSAAHHTAYSGDVNGRFRRDVNNVGTWHAGTCNDAAAYSHQSITRRIFRAAGRRRVCGRAKRMARINANDDSRRFPGHAAETTRAAHPFFHGLGLIAGWSCPTRRF